MIAEVGGMGNGEIRLNPIYEFRETVRKDAAGKESAGKKQQGRTIMPVKAKEGWKKVGELENRDKLISAGCQL